ncbi:hypothetical protein ACVV2G_28465 [Streptomyces ziwulingensis]
MAYLLIDSASLQRGRITDLVLKGDDPVDADQAAQQISLDHTRHPWVGEPYEGLSTSRRTT